MVSFQMYSSIQRDPTINTGIEDIWNMEEAQCVSDYENWLRKFRDIKLSFLKIDKNILKLIYFLIS